MGKRVACYIVQCPTLQVLLRSRVYRIGSDLEISDSDRIGSDFRIQSEIRSEPIRSVDNFVLLILCFLHVLDHKEQKIFFPL